MKKFLGGLALGLCVAAPAMAADIPVKARPAPVAVAMYNWSGCYIGVQGGIGILRSDNSFSATGAPPFTPEAHTNGSGGVAGGHIGCNYQAGAWVIGIEGDGEWAASLKGNDGQAGGDINELSARWMASARGRLGYAWNNALLYVTGGGAWMNVRSAVLNPPLESFTRTITGWTVGAGIEYGFTPNFSGRFEYRYADYGDKNFTFPINGYVERHGDIHTHIFRGGLTYRFGGFGSPVVARY
jgi:outer membrane immunogenic protein